MKRPPAFTRLNATEADSVGLTDWNIEFDPFMEGNKWFFNLSLSYKGTDTVSKLRVNISGYESERETDFSKGLKLESVPLDSSSNELRIDMTWYIDGKEHQGMKKYDLAWNP